MNTGPLAALVARWESEAETLRRWGQKATAEAVLRCADELRHAEAQAKGEALTVAEAAAASGYSTSRLYSMLNEGKLTNVGTKNRPRVRAGDLPRKSRARSDGTLELLSRLTRET